MKAKLYRLEKFSGRGNEIGNWGQAVGGLKAYFVRDDKKEYILEFIETIVCQPVFELDKKKYKFDAYTEIGFGRRTRIGRELETDMIGQVRESLGV